MKVQSLEVSNSSPGPSEENPANTTTRNFAVETLSYKNLRTTSTDPAPDIDPTKREVILHSYFPVLWIVILLWSTVFCEVRIPNSTEQCRDSG